MSQIMSHIEYLKQMYSILMLMLHSKLMKKLAPLTAFITIEWWFLIVAYFWAILYNE